MLLYINGQLAELDAGQVIAQTKQVNDINSLENRQANYTNKFKLPKTAANIRLMNFLTLTGNESAIPYQKNECSLYSDSGECFVYNGWAVITDGGDSYEAVIYDGIIDLYKAIENQNLDTLDLGEINHTKNLQNVYRSWFEEANLNYRYILADYNGKTGFTIANNRPSVAIDYLVPSISVAWLWHKIFTTYNISYSGSVFKTQQFKNLWLTYPKGLITQDEGTEVFTCSSFPITNAEYGSPIDRYRRTCVFHYAPENQEYLNYFEPDSQKIGLRVKERGTYKMTIKCKMNTKDSVRVFIAKNVLNNNSPYLDTLTESIIITPDLGGDAEFEKELFLQLDPTSSISLLMRHRDGTRHAVRFNDFPEMEITITRINEANINFGDAFADFSIKDFLSEVIQRFGLTLFKDRFTGRYDFLTLQELLQSPDPVDLSNKFVRKISENYIYGNYAQNNWFRYNYNEKESTHNDGCLTVANANLPEGKDVLKSKIYSPEAQLSNYLGRTGKVYKLWEKEINDDPDEGEEPVKYKSLDKRFYFLRAEYVPSAIRLSFEATHETPVSQSAFWRDNYWKLPFDEILTDYYSPMRQLLSKSQIVTVDLYLNDMDIAGFDFKKLYYLEQLGSYFIMNKINNYVPGKTVRCEMIRLNPAGSDVVAAMPLTVSKITVSNTTVTVHFTADDIVNTVTLVVLNSSGQKVASRASAANMSPLRVLLPVAGSYRLRLESAVYTTAWIPLQKYSANDNQTILL